MDIVSYIQASKAKKEIRDLNKIVGAGDLYKSGQLPVEDVFDTVRERVENLESISPTDIMLTEINEEIEQAHIKAVKELAETINEVEAEVEGLESVKHFNLSSEVSSQSVNVSYSESKSGLVFGDSGEALFTLPKNNLVKLAAYAVAFKEEHKEKQDISFTLGDNLTQVEGGYMLLDKSKPATIESDLITLDQSDDVYLLKDVKLNVEVLYSTHEDFSSFIDIKYAPLISRSIVEPEAPEEEIEALEEEEVEVEPEIILEFGEYLDKLPYGVDEFKIKITLHPIEEFIPEPEPEPETELEPEASENEGEPEVPQKPSEEFPAESGEGTLKEKIEEKIEEEDEEEDEATKLEEGIPEENSEDEILEDVELLSKMEEKEDEVKWDNYVLKVNQIEYTELIPVEAKLIFNEREFDEGEVLPVYESEFEEDVIKVLLEEEEILHSLTVSWIER